MNDEYDVTNSDTMGEGTESQPLIESVSEDVSTDSGSNITVVINNPSVQQSADDIEVKDSIQAISEGEEELVLQSVSVSTERVTASDATGLKSVVLSVIGDYETVITDYEYRTGSSSYVSHSIDVQPDYAWMITAALFAICLYSCFRLYGLVFGRRGR